MINGKFIRVVYEEKEKDVLAITAYITSKIRKYGGG